jgi:hypothetical protein
MVNSDTQLWAPPSVFKGAPNGTASSAQFVWTMRNMAQLASFLEDQTSASTYSQQANSTAQAVNQLLFNSATGSYAVSTTDGNYSYIDSRSRDLYGEAATNDSFQWPCPLSLVSVAVTERPHSSPNWTASGLALDTCRILLS